MHRGTNTGFRLLLEVGAVRVCVLRGYCTLGSTIVPAMVPAKAPSIWVPTGYVQEWLILPFIAIAFARTIRATADPIGPYQS